MANNQLLFSVGTGDFIAYKGGILRAMGKATTETSFEVTAEALDIRAGKRAPLRCRYNHSSGLSFNIICANFSQDYIQGTNGGESRAYGNLQFEESIILNGTTGTLTNEPVAVGEINKLVWITYEGAKYTAVPTGKTFTAPAGIPSGSTVCVLYLYKDINATSFAIPAETNPEIWHIFIDIDLATDKSGAGIVGREVIEIPLGQLDPNQSFSATMDGYSETKISGFALADTSRANCVSGGNYAYINTQIFDQKWYDNVRAIVNDDGDIKMVKSSTQAIHLLALENEGTYKALDPSYYGDLSFVYTAGTATGSSFNNGTGLITAGTTVGTATLAIKITSKPTIDYILQITVEA